MPCPLKLGGSRSCARIQPLYWRGSGFAGSSFVGSNCLEPVRLPRRDGPQSWAAHTNRLAEVPVLSLARFPERGLGELLQVVRDVFPSFHGLVEHQGHFARAVPVLSVEAIHRGPPACDSPTPPPHV